MAAADIDSRESNFWGIVDMGSNGIRFTITDLGPQKTRRMPVLWSRRAGISLHDSLHSNADDDDDDAGDIAESADNSSAKDGVLSQDTIDSVVREIKAFTQTCRQWGVPPSQMKVMATEATRAAKNSTAFTSAIHQSCGVEVTLLLKEEEAYYGALGVRSSFDTVKGLMMDLGGGSMQLTYLDSTLLGNEHKKPTGVSVPFGAAALNRGLSLAKKKGNAAVAEWETSITSAVNQAFQGLVKDEPALKEALNHPNKLDLYLCGGGFRGWGNLLMHNRGNYPIPAIHAFKIKDVEFLDHKALKSLETGSGDNDKDKYKPFRISERRKSQLPVVGLLVRSVAASIGQNNIGNVVFCQGGIRDGYLFSQLSPTQAAQPLLQSGLYLSPRATALLNQLRRSLPTDPIVPTTIFTPDFLALLASIFDPDPLTAMPKECRAAAGLHIASVGQLAAFTQLSHLQRAIIGVVMCERWGGELPGVYKPVQQGLEGIIIDEDEGQTARLLRWCRYVGRAIALGDVILGWGKQGPSKREEMDGVIKAVWKDVRQKKKDGDIKRKVGVSLLVRITDKHKANELVFTGAVKDLEKVGRGKEGWGVEITLVGNDDN